jgi:hypothetical protein
MKIIGGKMKNMTVKTSILLIIMMAVTFNLTAAEKLLNEKSLNRAEQNFLVTMDSDLNSLVESAIFNMIMFKDKYPEWNFKNINQKLKDLVIEGNSLSIRYKAQLVSMFLSNPELFERIEITEKDNPAKYFRILSEQLTNRIVAAN